MDARCAFIAVVDPSLGEFLRTPVARGHEHSFSSVYMIDASGDFRGAFTVEKRLDPESASWLKAGLAYS